MRLCIADPPYLWNLADYLSWTPQPYRVACWVKPQGVLDLNGEAS